MQSSEKVLVIVPHPDDAEFFAGGLLAKFAEDGYQIKIITATDGCCGTYQHDRAEIAQIRAVEAKNAADLIGAELELLGFHDYELINVPSLDLRGMLVERIRSYRPDIAVFQDPQCKDEVHPDHRTLAWAASDAIQFAQLPNVFPDHQKRKLEPHFVSEKYAYSEDPTRWNKIVDITATFSKKMEMMRKHQSQVDFLVEDVIRQAEVAGLDAKVFMGRSFTSPFDALKLAMEATAKEIGQAAGLAYGEGYHYTRFHPYVEALISSKE